MKHLLSIFIILFAQKTVERKDEQERIEKARTKNRVQRSIKLSIIEDLKEARFNLSERELQQAS